MSNLIRSANGKMIDMEQIRLKNEKVIALGNMGVNARGDVVVKKEVPQSRASRLKDHYQLHSAVPESGSYKKSNADIAPPARERPTPEEQIAEAKSDTRQPRGSLATEFTEGEVPPPPKE